MLGFLAGDRSARPKYLAAPVAEAIKKTVASAVVEIEVSDVVRFEDVRALLQIDIPRTSPVRLHGRVTGGFDPASVVTVEADDKTKTARVMLPQPAVMSIDDRVEWYHETAGWMKPTTIGERARWTSWARGSLARSARAAGLMERAQQTARDLIGGTAAALGWKADVLFSPIPNARPDPGLAAKK